MQDNERKASFKIVIRRVERPFSNDPFEELDWICRSFGFFERTDNNNTASNTHVAASSEGQSIASKLFAEILASVENPKQLTSTYLSERLKMSRTATINQLNNLQRSGLIIKQGRIYVPRSKSMERTIEEIEEDIERLFARMKKTAKEIDKEMGLVFEE